MYVYLGPQNVTLFGNGVLAGVTTVRTKMRSHWIGVSPKSNESVLLRDTEAHGEGCHLNAEVGRDGSDEATRQRTLGPQGAGRGREDAPWSPLGS